MAALHDGSPVVTALPAARGALDERRLVGMDASDLSVLAGARAGMVGATLRTRRQETELQPLETRTSGGVTAYLKVEKPRFLFLEGSAGAAVAPVVAVTALPDAFAALAGASATHAASSTDRPVMGVSAPSTGSCPSAASAALGDGGGGFHLSGGGVDLPPRCSPLPPPRPTTSSPESRGERVPAARAAGTPRPAALGAPAAGFSSPSYAPPSPAPAAARRWRPPGHRALVDPTVRRTQSPSANDIRQNHTGTPRETERKGEAYLPARHREA
jgi:hypothetical protein